MRAPLLICATLTAAFVGSASAAADPKDVTAVSGVEVVARRATALSEVTVSAKLCLKARSPADRDARPPRLVSTFPRKGSVAPPGLLILRLTFDRPMTCDGLLQELASRLNPCPPPLRSPMISRDRRTFLTVCEIGENSHYGLRLTGFTSVAGQPLEPEELVFDTSAAPKVSSVEQAMAQDAELQKAAYSRR